MNDETVEGAVKLINKIGYLIDDKIQREEKKAAEKKTKPSKFI